MGDADGDGVGDGVTAGGAASDDSIRWNRDSLAAKSGPRRQALTPKLGNPTYSSRSPPSSLHTPPAAWTTGTGVGFGRLKVAAPSNVTTMLFGGSWVNGFWQAVACTKTDGHGSAIGALLRNSSGPGIDHW